MAKIAPASKIESLVNDIVDLSRGKSPNEVRLKGIENQVNKLMDDDPAHANLALGMLQALRGNKDQAHRHHKIACDLAPDDVVCIKNWAISCIILHDLDMAVQKIQEAIRLEPADLSAKSDLLSCLVQSGRYLEALENLNHYRGKGMDEQLVKLTGEHLLHEIDHVAKLMVDRGLTDEALVVFMQCIHKVLGIDGASNYKIRCDEETINFRFLCAGNVDEIFDLQMKIIDEFVALDVEVTSKIALVSFSLDALEEEASCP